VPLGSVMHDNATLSGATAGFTPTGALTFTFSGGALGANEVGRAACRDRAENTAGPAAREDAYSFSAAYAGDSNYNAIPSGTHNPETFFVDKGTLTLTTTVHDASHNVVADGAHVPLGSVMHDNATLSGATAGFTPTGALTFTFHRCAPGATGAPQAGFYAPSTNPPARAPLLPDSTFSPAYAGDSNYNAIPSGTHNPETFFVDKGTSTTATVIKDTSGNPISNPVAN